MPTVAIRLDPTQLSNPDTDMRYALPDLLAKRSNGIISDDGYDYVGEKPYLMIFLSVDDAAKALELIQEVITNEEVLSNKLNAAATIALKEGAHYKVVYPLDFVGEFQTNE